MVARSPVSRGGAERRAALRRSACGEVVLGNTSYLTSHSEKRSTYPRFSAASRSCSPALPLLYRRPGCLQLVVTCRQSTQHRPDTFLHTHSRLSFTHIPFTHIPDFPSHTFPDFQTKVHGLSFTHIPGPLNAGLILSNSHVRGPGHRALRCRPVSHMACQAADCQRTSTFIINKSRIRLL